MGNQLGSIKAIKNYFCNTLNYFNPGKIVIDMWNYVASTRNIFFEKLEGLVHQPLGTISSKSTPR